MDTSLFWRNFETLPPGVGFSYFGVFHLCWLLGTVLFCVGMCLWYRRMAPRGQKRCLRAVAALLLADEAFLLIPIIVTHGFRWWYLPFHLCSINIFVCLAYAIRPSQTIGELLYALCLPGAAAALLFPAWQTLPPFNFLNIHSFILHILLLLFPLLLLSTGQLRPSVRRLPRCLGFLLVTVPPLYVLDRYTDSNFFFLVGAPEILAPVERAYGQWGYLVTLFVIVLAVWVILYLPLFFLSSGKKRSRRG